MDMPELLRRQKMENLYNRRTKAYKKREILDESSDSFLKHVKDTISNIFEKQASQKRQKKWVSI